MRFSVDALSILRPLARGRIAILWSGVAISAVGDEFYNVAVIWLAVGLVGAGAGYLAACQCVAVVVAALLASAVADGWDRRRAMIGADLFRAAVALIPVALWFHSDLTVWHLIPVIVLISGAKAFFDPALQAAIPSLAKDRALFQSTNGLFDATRRLARVTGPALIVIAGTAVPLIHYFTINALTFFASALCVALVLNRVPAATTTQMKPASPHGASNGIAAVFTAIKGHRLLQLALVAHAVASGAWYLSIILGLALRVRTELHLEISAYGLLIAAYGIGNLLATIAVTALQIRHAAFFMFAGRLVAGAGYIGLGLSGTLPEMMAWAAIAAVGAPMSNIPFLNILQADFSQSDIGRLYRLRMVAECGGIAAILTIAPTLLSLLTTANVIALCGLSVGFVGLIGMMFAARLDRAGRPISQNQTS